MNSIRLVRMLTVLALLAASGWFLWLARRALAQSTFWATMGPVYLPADAPAYLAQVRRSTDWQTPLVSAVLPLAVLAVWWLVRTLRRRARISAAPSPR